MDINNLGMTEAEILQAPETRLVIYLFIFLSQAGNKIESFEEHTNCKKCFCKRGPFQGKLGVKRAPLLNCSPIGLKLHQMTVKEMRGRREKRNYKECIVLLTIHSVFPLGKQTIIFGDAKVFNVI